MARGLLSSWAFYKNITTNALFIGGAPEVTVYKAGTTTPIAGTRLHDAPSGGSSVGNPFNGDSDGSFFCWIDDPEPLKVEVTIPLFGTLTQDNIPPWIDISGFVTLDGFETVSNKTLEDWYDKGGVVFDIGAFPVGDLDPYEAANDATPSIHAAAEACAVRGGGTVVATKVFSMYTPVIWKWRNVKFAAVGGTQISYNPKVCAVIRFSQMPAWVIRDDPDLYGLGDDYDPDYEGTGSECEIHNLSMYPGVAITTNTGSSNPAITPADTQQFVGCKSAILTFQTGPSALRENILDPTEVTGYTYNGRVSLYNVMQSGFPTAIQNGYASDSGTAEFRIYRCKHNTSQEGIIVKGGGYVLIEGCITGQDPIRNASYAWILLDGSATSQPDGIEVRNNFTEDYYCAFEDRHSAGGVGNSGLYFNLFDGCRIGVYLHPTSTINGFIARGNTINGNTNSAGNDKVTGSPVSQSWGFLIERTAGSFGKIQILWNRIAEFASQAVLVTPVSSFGPVSELEVDYNTIYDCGHALGGIAAAMIDICGTANNSSTFSVDGLSVWGNRMFATGMSAPLRPGHGIRIGIGTLRIREGNNQYPESAAGVLWRGGAQPNLLNERFCEDIGPVQAGYAPVRMTWDIHFHHANFPASAADTPLTRGTGDAAGDGVTGWVAPYNCWLVGLTARSKVAIAGASISLRPIVDGVVKLTPTATIAVAAQKARATHVLDGSIFVAQDAVVELGGTTSGAFTPNDISADLFAVSA